MRAAILVLFLLLNAALAQQPRRDAEKERQYAEQLSMIAPAALEDFRKGTEALDQQQFAVAEKYFAAVAKAAPDFDPAVRRYGSALVAGGKREEGMRVLEKVAETHRTPENLISLAMSLMFAGGDKKTQSGDLPRALQLAREANSLNTEGKDIEYAAMLAQIALANQSKKDLSDAVAQMNEHHPQQMLTHYYGAVLAGWNGDNQKAKQEIEAAGKAGLPADIVKEFSAAVDASNNAAAGSPSDWRWSQAAGVLTGVWIIGLLFLYVSGKGLSTATLQSIETGDPNAVVTEAESSLRSRYRSLISLASTYYYISLPFVILLVIAVAGSIFYGFLLIGRIPIKLILILGLGAAITIYKMIQTLFIKKVEAVDPGRPLTQEEAPGLWAMTKEVASKVGTRPIDEIRITEGTEMAVYEKGSNKEKNEDRARRILLMGTGLLHGFKQGAFRAVLAHEYGHFSHRDTAGGDIALRVNQDMMKFAQAMAHNGQAVWYNIGFQFLRLYHFLFRRITHGATRLQEVQADRVAAKLYGAGSFEEGLRHVIRRSIEFNVSANKEVTEALQEKRPFKNLYSLETPADADISTHYEEAVNRPTTEDDTHPGPMDRFRLLSKLNAPSEAAARGEIWELFTNPDQLTAEMSGNIERSIRGAQ